jgi:DMSO/TMAO reductase YedYZ molybdopterin-dependent catalytic subunit
MSIEKAMEPDTILAYVMNGEILPPDHGFPLRAIVPGWVGTNSIKWIDTITVSSEKIWVYRNADSYVYIGPEWPPENHAPVAGAPINEQNIKSSLALPWPAILSPGPQTLRGFARSSAKIAKVEWSADGGQTWHQATLLEPNMKYAWVQFEFTWEVAAGEHALMTRATDELGQTQPDIVPHNKIGFLFNMVHPHPVIVT